MPPEAGPTFCAPQPTDRTIDNNITKYREFGNILYSLEQHLVVVL
jgi:hypothetical protein